MKETYSTGFSSYREGIVACIPTILGYFGIGLAAGIVGKSSGLSVMSVVLMSAIVYGGSSQFIITSMLVTGSSVSLIIFTTFLVNLRHFLMSLSVSDYFKKFSVLQSIGIGSLLTDESYGVLMTAVLNEKQVSFKWINGLNLTAYVVWIGSTFLGALLGNVIPNPYLFGLDFALVAMFIGLVILQIEYPLKKNKRNTLFIIFSTVFSMYGLSNIMSIEMSVLVATLLGCGVGVFLDGKN